MTLRPATDVKQALIIIEGTNGLSTCDIIEHDGMLWLVPEWRDNPAEGWTMPQRIVLALAFGLQETAQQNHQYLLQMPVPEALLEGGPPESAGQKVIEMPDIRFERLTIQ